MDTGGSARAGNGARHLLARRGRHAGARGGVAGVRAVSSSGATWSVSSSGSSRRRDEEPGVAGGGCVRRQHCSTSRSTSWRGCVTRSRSLAEPYLRARSAARRLRPADARAVSHRSRSRFRTTSRDIGQRRPAGGRAARGVPRLLAAERASSAATGAPTPSRCSATRSRSSRCRWSRCSTLDADAAEMGYLTAFALRAEPLARPARGRVGRPATGSDVGR